MTAMSTIFTSPALEPRLPGLSSVAAQRRWRELQATPGARTTISIAIVASYTVEPLVPYLGCLLAERGLHARFTLAPFGQVYPSLLDPDSVVRNSQAAITLVLVRLEDLCPRPLAELARLEPVEVGAARAAAQDEITRLCETVETFVAASPHLVLIGTLPAPPTTPLGMLDASHPSSLVQLVRTCNLALGNAVQRSPWLRLIDIDHAIAQLGAERAWDPRMDVLSGCPWSSDGLRRIAEHLTRAITALVVPAAKVVVVDLDQTLWGGILGEDGADGIVIGPTGLGSAFQAFQAALLALRAQGVLLAVASKNAEADALAILDHHPGMRIRRHHLAAHRISWRPKSESLRELAVELGLGLDSFVFLDDSATECTEIHRMLPEVTVILLPPDPAHYVARLRAIPQLDRMTLTDADRGRATAWAAEPARRAAHALVANDPAAMRAHLRSLELVVGVRRLRDGDVARAAQLTQKTNQFNLTTVRRNEADIAALRRDPTWRLYALDVTDRFGDYGTTGLVCAHQTASATWDLETVLLSCRVLGRGVESALLRAVIGDLVDAGARQLTSRWIPTARNAPARDFLPRHGFVAVPDSGPGQGYIKALLPGTAFDDAHITVRLG